MQSAVGCLRLECLHLFLIQNQFAVRGYAPFGSTNRVTASAPFVYDFLLVAVLYADNTRYRYAADKNNNIGPCA